jgi:hypothetical protein
MLCAIRLNGNVDFDTFIQRPVDIPSIIAVVTFIQILQARTLTIQHNVVGLTNLTLHHHRVSLDSIFTTQPYMLA